MSVQDDIRLELEAAEQARLRGNEGKARVCARRAAGIGVREYFRRRGEQPRTSSAYDLLRLIAQEPALPANLKESALRLALRVDEDFSLPPGVDLIAEARGLCAALLSDSSAAT